VRTSPRRYSRVLLFIYPLGESVHLTNFNLYLTPGLQDKIVRYERYKEDSFISFPLTCGKLCSYCSKGAHKEKRHLKGCLTLAHCFLPYLLIGRGLKRQEETVTSPPMLPQI